MKKEIKKPLPNNVKNTKTKSLAKRVLIGLFLFWTIGSIVAFSCLVWLVSDKHKNDTAMITASADSTFVRSYTLNDYLCGTYVDDGDINIYNDDISLSVNGVGYFQLTSVQGGTIEHDYNTWYDISIKFATINGSETREYVIACQYLVGGGSIANLDSTYRLTSVFRSQYNGPYNTIISLSFLFENNTGLSLRFHLHLRTFEEFPFISIAPKTWEIGYDNDYITQLRGQINTLENEVQSLQNRITTLQIDLEASEGLRESETALLNEEITTLRNALLNLDNIISQKNEEIEELEAEIREITAGKNKIYQNGYDTGFADGATAGAADAYNQGYAAAVADGHGGGNFRSMIGALIDVPVNAITSLLDWNLLGINLKEFFFSILSVIVVVKIAMLFMR